MNQHDSLYLQTCQGLLEYGRPSSDRTGTGTTKAPGLNMRFFMQDGFPLLTSKFTGMRLIELELRAFLNGITDNNFLSSQNVHIWDAFANEKGELGPIYGAMWRNWPVMCQSGESYEVDQIAELMKGLREKPMSRRHIVTGWNPALLPVEGRSHAENVNAGLQALPPCHTMWQVHCHELTVEEREEQHKLRNGSVLLGSKTESFRHQVLDRLEVPKYGVSLQLFQRSADMFLGVPFNIASYSLLLHYIAHSLNMVPHSFIWNGGDCHIYNNHVEQMNLQISREKDAPPSPQIRFKCAPKDIWDYTADDFEIVGYEHMGKIQGDVAV
ncbi:thymidylate synthase [Pseudomonas phage nickie]|uniref:thymidylate synthase n=1 Tax=Pseudomonas phage nickie TaxID=2048977 RepID=A0A2H4P772_9CAUD|nr:thymidylate synthase [Pseudomonas phage nickie]ATW58019.1 thymidylate synthase [Pseudomonas phage nickie]